MPSPPATNIGSRFYLMAGQNKYQMFTLLGNEFTMDVDVSKLGCGLNGAVYFVSWTRTVARPSTRPTRRVPSSALVTVTPSAPVI